MVHQALSSLHHGGVTSDRMGEVEPDAPTEFAGFDKTDTEIAHAWALDYEDATPTERLLTPKRITSAAVAVSLVLIATAGAIAFVMIRDDGRPAAPASTTAAAAPSPVPPAPAPATVTQTVAVKVPTAADIARNDPGPTKEQDAEFVRLIKQDGWPVYDPRVVASTAHDYCRQLRAGTTAETLNQQIASMSGFGMSMALAYSLDAMAAYPGCRFGVG